MKMQFWLSHPMMCIHRVRYWVWEKLNPDEPWMCPGTIQFCARHLNPSMVGLEFGSGRSTAWFAGLVGHLTSVENDPEWHRKVVAMMERKNVRNVDYKLISLSCLEAPHDRPEHAAVPSYVRVADLFPERSLDLVIVDGYYRDLCIQWSVSKIKPGGYLLVDDINHWSSLDGVPVPKNWRIVDDSTNGLKRCIIWQAM